MTSTDLANTTVADIVTLARVSRNTFYEHFASREDCSLVLYETISAQALHALSAAIEPGAIGGRKSARRCIAPEPAGQPAHAAQGPVCGRVRAR